MDKEYGYNCQHYSSFICSPSYSQVPMRSYQLVHRDTSAHVMNCR